MKYVNTSLIKKMVMVNMLGRYVNPGEIIDLSPVDISILGTNANFILPVDQVQKLELVQKPIVEKEVKVKKKRISKKSKSKSE